MSGHSKWATTHRQKEVKDAKKGAVFTKMAAAITMAVKQGGGIGDIEKNFKLRLAVERARQANMPKDNINRAIEKGMGNSDENTLEEVVFEGFLPGGVVMMVEALTDNHLRTGQEIRMILEHHGGTLGGSGAVGYLFNYLGELKVKYKADKSKSTEDQELEIIDAGAEDFEDYGEGWLVYCHRDKTYEIKQKLEKMGYEVESFGLVMKPLATVEVADEEIKQRIENILDTIGDLDDVTNVWTNYA